MAKLKDVIYFLVFLSVLITGVLFQTDHTAKAETLSILTFLLLLVQTAIYFYEK